MAQRAGILLAVAFAAATASTDAASSMKCDVCSHVYNPTPDCGGKDDPTKDCGAGVAFADLAAAWKCPVCGQDKTHYHPVGTTEHVAHTHGSEIQCIGRVAHQVTYAINEDDPDDITLAVEPKPEHNNQCLGGGPIGDKKICVGVNHDATCAGPKKQVIDLPFGAKCQGCFVGAETDFFYSVNISKFQVQHLGLGFRDTQVRTKLAVGDDHGWATKPRSGNVSFFQHPHAFNISIFGRTLAQLKVSMPTSIFYDYELSRGDGHGEGGASLLVEMGENSIEYNKGKGWSHVRDKAKVTLDPIIEGDFNGEATLTVGAHSSLRVEVVDTMWFHVDLVSTVPITLTSTGTSGADLIHTCGSSGLGFTASHEADIHTAFFKKPFHEHFGPKVDEDFEKPHFLHKCVDVHPKRPHTIVV